MANIDLPKRSGKRSKVREKSVKSQGILKMILSGNPGSSLHISVCNSRNIVCVSLFGVILETTNSSFQFCRSIYVKKVMKPVALIFTHHS